MEYRKENLNMLGGVFLHSLYEGSNPSLFTRGFGKSTKPGNTLFYKAVSELGNPATLDSLICN